MLAHTAWLVLICQRDGHNKFWKIRRVGESPSTMKTVERCWGKVGTQGMRKTAVFRTPERAKAVMVDLIESKLRKGYLRVTTTDESIDHSQDEATSDHDFLERLRAKVKKQWGVA